MMRRDDMERLHRMTDAAVKRLIRAHAARQERRARVALMFFRPDQLAWAYHPGEPEPRIEVRL